MDDFMTLDERPNETLLTKLQAIWAAQGLTENS